MFDRGIFAVYIIFIKWMWRNLILQLTQIYQNYKWKAYPCIYHVMQFVLICNNSPVYIIFSERIITPFYFIKCDITKLYTFFQFWFYLLIHWGNKTYRLDLLRIVPGTQINIPNRLCSVEFLSLYHNINIHKHIWSKEYLFRNTVVTCEKLKYKFSKKPFPILSG